MPPLGNTKSRPSFGPFEVDLSAGELRKHGFRIRLQEKPFQVLTRLLERQGEVVTREELHDLLWPGNHFVEFDHNLNNAIKKLRLALDDSPDQPQFIETIPKRGYRFIAPVDWVLPDRVDVKVSSSLKDKASDAPVGMFRARWKVLAAIGCIGIVLATVSFYSFRRWRGTGTVRFQARDWVLITNFENRTGDRLLDGTVEFALERELTNSKFVNVVPRERAEDSLRLMKMPSNITIDRAVGREVAIRDGGIRALLVGRDEKFGGSYDFSVEIVEPSRNSVVSVLSEAASNQNDVLSAIHRLSNRVRLALGEELPAIQQSDLELAKVTTPSLHAVEFYSQADRLMDQEGPRKSGAAEALLKQAIQDDPQFASAYIHLAWTLYNSGATDEEYIPYAKSAYDLSANASPTERYFIQGSYFQMMGLRNNRVNGHRPFFPDEQKRAADSYEALLRINPDYHWAVGNLYFIDYNLNRQEEFLRMAVRFSEVTPHALRIDVLARAAYYLDIQQGNAAAAAPFFSRAAAVVPVSSSPPPRFLMFADWVQFFPAEHAWFNDDIEQAKADLSRVESSPKWHDAVVFPFTDGEAHALLGEFKTAAALFAGIPDPVWRAHGIALLHLLRNEVPSLRSDLNPVRRQPPPELYPLKILDVALLARAGYVADAEARIPDMNFGTWSIDPFGEATKALLLVAQGRGDAGLPKLKSELERDDALRQNVSFLGAEVLANDFEKKGDLQSARVVLERMSGDRRKLGEPESLGMVEGMFWMRNQLHLARVYNRLGQSADAKKIETELRLLLKYADSDDPMSLELNQLGASPGQPGSRRLN
ncbi:MAG TPA: winged helix-turn-helix domain-containing protein [Candidatus Sulfotelmatobacter sp.]|nr:winged helix-turn-helix domain-containing protein [Candidatus Sulfotelmatobacter sp.]